MKLIIAGGRDIDEMEAYVLLVHHLRGPARVLSTYTEIVSGGAKGVDAAGESFAEFYQVPVKRFPADWNQYGAAAGPIRNREMSLYADVLLLIWDGKSRGSANMKRQMQRLGKPVVEIIL